ncbi:MAG: FHA domain-containing protein, partial [Actinobacteria bacterium]|nr:FHA domain-containing protein [Actinomycetota bacterium]
MTDTLVCPVCNGPIQSKDHECHRCGFRLAGSTQSFEPIKISTVPTTEAAAPDVSGTRYSLFVSKGPQANEEFFLDAPKMTFGRDPHCDIFLNDMTVSREHAMVLVEDDSVSVKDMNSLNGTWVNGKVVEEAILTPGSLLQIGTFSMVL